MVIDPDFLGEQIINPNAPIAQQLGADTIINFRNGDVLTLQNINVTDLTEDDFIFNQAPPNQAPVITASGRCQPRWWKTAPPSRRHER